MAIYTMSADWADRRARGLARGRSFGLRLAIGCAIVDAFLLCVKMGWIYKSWQINEVLFRSLMIGSFVVIIQALTGSWRKSGEAALAGVQVQSLEIDEEHVRTSNGIWSRRIRRDEIQRADEPHRGLGLYLRTSNPFRWLLIPKNIDGYEEIKSGLAASAIPVTRTRLSPHWIETLAFFITMASMVTVLVARSRDVLLVNLAVGVVVAAVGLFIAYGRADNRKLQLQYGLFYCFPLIFAVVLWPRHH